MSLMPSVNPYRMTVHGPKDHVIAVGQAHFAVVSESGAVCAEVRLEQIPVSSPVIADFNDDGLNDVIIVTTDAIYGYTQRRHVATKLFSLLVGVLLAALLLTAVARGSSTPGSRPATSRFKTTKAQL